LDIKIDIIGFKKGAMLDPHRIFHGAEWLDDAFGTDKQKNYFPKI